MPNPGEAQAYYEDFSLAVGQRDWLRPNLRHEQLKLLIDELLRGRNGLRIADVGCGAGVMTDHLTRYGDVIGIDFSTAAIAAAERFAPRATFRAGTLETLTGRFDVITLFDVLEHIPEAERPAFLRDIAERLAPAGLLFCSTPHATATAYKRAADDPALQIIDEEVDVATVVTEAAEAGLQLLGYKAYDVWAGSPEYQAFTFTPATSYGGPPALRPQRLEQRRRLMARFKYGRVRRQLYAARALSRGDLKTAMWFARGDAPDIRS
jgi:SAM-dependent methyltransferase